MSALPGWSPSARPEQGVLGAASRLYRATFTACLPTALTGALLSTAVGLYAVSRVNALGNGLAAALANLLQVSGALPDPSQTFGVLLTRAHALLRSPALWGSYAGAAFVTLLTHAVLIRQQQGAGLGTALRNTARRIPAMVLALLMLGMGVAAGCLLFALSLRRGFGTAMAVALGLLVMATWLWGRLQFWLVAMMTRNLGALSALGDSWQAVEGHWWRASSLMTLPYLAALAVSWAAQLTGAVFGLFLGASSQSGRWAAEVCSLAGAVLALPMLTVAWVTLYAQLQAKKNPATSGV
jgi:hypothetical protein